MISIKSKKKIRLTVMICSVLLLIGCVIFLIYYLGIQPYHSKQLNNKYKSLYYSVSDSPESDGNNEVIDDDSSENTPVDINLDKSYEKGAKGADGILLKFSKLLEINSDIRGWLKVPGTNIDYPVMWTPEDETYYLYRAFDGSENKNGCLLLDDESCVDPLTTNLIIHGHNMKSGAMFGNLTDYENQDFYKEHKNIILYTEECQRNYEIIAVFRSQVYRKTDQVFKFYKFFQADTQEEFDDFYNNIKQLSQYDTGVTAEFGDHFLTLSTCVYHVEQGRFVVVAKEVEPGDHYLPIQE